MGSMSRSKMADDDECLHQSVSFTKKGRNSKAYTEVGDEGIDPGEREPNLLVLRSCEFL